MSDEIAQQLTSAGNGYLVAPAGHGKTEVIARAVACQSQGKSLLLTHTHAGVKSLKKRLRILGVPTNRYRVETIASWALELASSFPKLSNINNDQPQGDEWQAVYQFANSLLNNKNIKLIINKSYSGIYVDEYQDCTKSQHNLIMSLSKIIPVRILGDPLQGIFGFTADPLINWENEVYPNFENLGQLEEPWRWKKSNPELGDWLRSVRDPLTFGDEFDLRNAPRGSVTWLPINQTGVRDKCFKASKQDGSIVAIHKWASQAHSLASQLRGLYTSMEEIECRDLLSWAHNLDHADKNECCQYIIDGAGKCWTRLKGELRSISKAYKEGRFPRSRKYPQIVEKLNLIKDPKEDSGILLDSLRECQHAGDVLYRHELWQDMQRVLNIYQEDEFDSYEDAAWYIRNHARRQERNLANHIVSRTLLIKGLEFDHVIIANADQLDDPQNLYVALTRCRQSLVVFSNSPIIKRNPL